MDSLVCAIYNTISAEATEYKPEHGWADISALEDAEQLDKVSNNEMILFTLLLIIQVSGLQSLQQELRARCILSHRTWRNVLDSAARVRKQDTGGYTLD